MTWGYATRESISMTTNEDEERPRYIFYREEVEGAVNEAKITYFLLGFTLGALSIIIGSMVFVTMNGL